MRRLITFLFGVLLLSSLFLVSCRKQGSGWSVDTLLPLVDSRLSLQDVFEDSLIQTGGDDLLQLVYKTNVLDQTLTEFTVPDTSIGQNYPGPPVTINWDKKFPLVSDTANNTFEIDDIDLLKAEIQSGSIVVNLTSSIREDVEVTYIMPSAIKNGTPLQLVKQLKGGSISDPTEESVTIDLSGYTIDLRGKDLNAYNTFYFYFSVEFVDKINPDTVYNYGASDYVYVEQKLVGLQPSYGEGVFHTQVIEAEDEENDSIDIFNNILEGKMYLNEAQLNFSFENYIGADFQGVINGLSSTNSKTGESVDLQGDVIGKNVNLSRARKDPGGYDPPVIPSRVEFSINSSNSNIEKVIEILPDVLKYDVQFTLNPSGNTSGGNDFFFSNGGLKADLETIIPLHFGADNLLMVDTTDFNSESTGDELNNILGGHFRIHCKNWYPFDADLKVVLLDTISGSTMDLLLPDSKIEAGIVNDNGEVITPSESVISAPVSQEILNEYFTSNKAIIYLTFNTENGTPRKVYSNYWCGIKIVADLQYNLDIR